MQINVGTQNFPEVITYNHYRLAWYSFMNVLDIKYEEGFKCPKCGCEPRAIIMDATSLAFRKELYSWRSVFSKPSAKSEVKSGEDRL